MIFSLSGSTFFCNQHLLSLYNDGLIDDNSKMDREVPGKMARYRWIPLIQPYPVRTETIVGESLALVPRGGHTQ